MVNQVLRNYWLDRLIYWLESIRSHKYLATVYYKGSMKCGGAILSPNFVLSAAHCDYRKSSDKLDSLKVKAGVQNTSSAINVQEKSVSKITKHSGYSTASMKNDIMLIKLRFIVQKVQIKSDNRYLLSSASFSFNDYVSSVALPSALTAPTYSVCGWGFNTSTNGRDTKELNCFEGSNVQTSTCNSRYVTQIIIMSDFICFLSPSTGWDKLVQDGQFCIGSANAAPCFHDGGAPAVNGNKIYGLYTFPDYQFDGKTYPRNAKCAEKNKPGVFIQVKDYVQWIESNMK